MEQTHPWFSMKRVEYTVATEIPICSCPHSGFLELFFDASDVDVQPFEIPIFKSVFHFLRINIVTELVFIPLSTACTLVVFNCIYKAEHHQFGEMIEHTALGERIFSTLFVISTNHSSVGSEDCACPSGCDSCAVEMASAFKM